MNTFLEYIKRGTKQVEKGIKKYGGTLDDNNLSAVELIDHAVEESIDNIFYLLKLREQLETKSIKDKSLIKKNCNTCKYGECSIDDDHCRPCVYIESIDSLSLWKPKKEGSQ